MRVGRQPPVERDAAVVDERAAFALGAEPGVLELGDHADGEVVGHAGDVDVVARDAGETERGVGREATRERRELGRGVRVEVAVTLTPPEQHDRRVQPGVGGTRRGA